MGDSRSRLYGAVILALLCSPPYDLGVWLFRFDAVNQSALAFGCPCIWGIAALDLSFNDHAFYEGV